MVYHSKKTVTRTYHIKDSLGSQALIIYRNFTVFGHQKCIDILTWLHKHINLNKLHIFFICHLQFFLGDKQDFFLLHSTGLITKDKFWKPHSCCKEWEYFCYENITILPFQKYEGNRKGGEGEMVRKKPFSHLPQRPMDPPIWGNMNGHQFMSREWRL